MPWKVVEIIVGVDLETVKGKYALKQYHEVKLLFVRGINVDDDVDSSRKVWAQFLSTDPKIGTSTMLEAYALRWSIEVYFKEAKQNLGILKERTITLLSHTASIHLCAIRYLILMNEKLNGPDTGVGPIPKNIQNQLNSMCFAVHLWHNFRAIVDGTLKTLSRQMGCSVATKIKTIDTRIEQFFLNNLLLDVLTMELEYH